MTKRLAETAQSLCGAPMVHELAAAAEELLQEPALLDNGAAAGGGRSTTLGYWLADLSSLSALARGAERLQARSCQLHHGA